MSKNDHLLPPIDRLHREFMYDKEAGELLCRKGGPHRTPGKVAGYLISNDYTSYRWVTLVGVAQPIHRIIWLMHYGVLPKGEVDHIDRNGLNNKIDNLRDVTPTVNRQNKRKYCNNGSGYTGVNRRAATGKWTAYIRINRNLVHLGTFIAFEEAVAARQKAEIAYGFHTNHGK